MLPRTPLVVKLNQFYFSHLPSKAPLEAYIKNITKNSDDIKIKIFYSLPSNKTIKSLPSNIILILPSFYSHFFFRKKITSFPFPCYFFKKNKNDFHIYDIFWLNFFTKLPAKKICLSSYFFIKDLDQKPNLPKILQSRLRKKVFFKNDYLNLSLYNSAIRKLIEQSTKKKFNLKKIYFFFFNKLLKGFCK